MEVTCNARARETILLQVNMGHPKLCQASQAHRLPMIHITSV